MGETFFARIVKFLPFGRSMLTLLKRGLVMEYSGIPGVTGKKPIAENTTNEDIDPPSSSPGTPKMLSLK
jgi:hypothetical protein